MDYQITVQGEQKGPYSLSQIQNMWNSGTITSDSLYWDTEAEGWKPIKELVEPSPAPVLDELAEHDEESWHVHDVAPPVLTEPSPPVLNQPVPPKSKFKILILGIVVLMVIGLTVWGLSSLLAERPNLELSEAEKKKQKEIKDAQAKEDAKLRPSAKEHNKDTVNRLHEQKKKFNSVVGWYKKGTAKTVLRANGVMDIYNGESKVTGIAMNFKWQLKGNNIHVTADNGAVVIYRILANGNIQSYAGITASGEHKIFPAGGGSTLTRMR